MACQRGRLEHFTSSSHSAGTSALVSLAALEKGKLEDFSARRLLVGYASAAVVLASVVTLGVVFGQEIKKKVVEEATPVVFTPPQSAVKVPPVEAPKPPPPAPKAKSLAPPPLGPKADLAPLEAPKEAPKEGDPNAPKAAVEGVVGGSPDGVVGGTGTGGYVAKPQSSAPAAAAPVAAPAPVAYSTDQVIAPRALSQSLPAFPEEARRAGVQMVATVKYTVREDGTVGDVVVVKGHPLLDAEIVRAVSAWRFTPATFEGRPVKVTRFARLPFRPRS
jgi:protein TonB